ncbi:MAG: GFA family protein [Rhizobiaceae bacterium]|nr:GFA family protein [Rhizobiaceae bacterium]
MASHGGCYCGAVRYTVSGALRDVIYCHCSQCRKQSGHFYAATSCATDNLDIKGAEKLTWFRASDEARRGFCSVCGSALFWQRVGADTTSILAGSLENPTGLKAQGHIFVADKGDYYDIGDGLPRHLQAG